MKQVLAARAYAVPTVMPIASTAVIMDFMVLSLELTDACSTKLIDPSGGRGEDALEIAD